MVILLAFVCVLSVIMGLVAWDRPSSIFAWAVALIALVIMAVRLVRQGTRGRNRTTNA